MNPEYVEELTACAYEGAHMQGLPRLLTPCAHARSGVKQSVLSVSLSVTRKILKSRNVHC